MSYSRNPIDHAPTARRVRVNLRGDHLRGLQVARSAAVHGQPPTLPNLDQLQSGHPRGPVGDALVCGQDSLGSGFIGGTPAWRAFRKDLATRSLWKWPRPRLPHVRPVAREEGKPRRSRRETGLRSCAGAAGPLQRWPRRLNDVGRGPPRLVRAGEEIERTSWHSGRRASFPRTIVAPMARRCCRPVHASPPAIIRSSSSATSTTASHSDCKKT